MKVLILDNYDSFTWNLVHSVEATGAICEVVRSDKIALAEIDRLRPDRIVFSPGPFGPDRSGICPDVLGTYAGRVPILGVCLGMQVIAHAGGAAIIPSGKPMHGKQSLVHHDGAGLFRGIPNPFVAARYHSLIVAPGTLPGHLEVSAWADDGTILGCRVRGGGVDGILFHPESFLTPSGAQIIANFVENPQDVDRQN
ncbi:MAG: aminodeoxychorismate/anthranilate synthase component II [Acidobacteriota bacterium]|nr:aminodeoxychorismate/anthranilate synthase component II [Acidobacteriota bacterium]